MKSATILLPALAALLAAAGCRTARAPTTGVAIAYSAEEIAALKKIARDPRVFYMNVYREENRPPVFTDANRIYQELTVYLPFTSPAGTALPQIEARIGEGARIAAVTDTTTAESWAPLDRRRALGLEILGPEPALIRPQHVLDDVAGIAAVIPELRLSEFRVEMALVHGRAARGRLWPLTRDPRTGAADLVLGMNLLRAFAWVQWDFPNRLLVLSTEGPYGEGEAERLAALPLKSASGALAVDAVIEGRPSALILDIAGDYELCLDNPPGDIARQVSLGDVLLRRLETRDPRALGLAPGVPRLGLRALAPFRLTLDNRRKMLYIERPPDERTAPRGAPSDDLDDDLL